MERKNIFRGKNKKNGRVYPLKILKKQVDEYIKGPVASKTATGELIIQYFEDNDVDDDIDYEKEGMTEKEVNRELKKFEDVDDEDLVDEDTKELYEIQLEKASKWYDESRESVLASLNAEPITDTLY